MIELIAKGYTKHLGIYRGKVIDNLDPKKLARLKIHVPEIHGFDEFTGERPESGWSYPRVSGPITRIPDIGSDVWVQFESGDVERPIWEIAPFTFTDGRSTADEHIQGDYSDRDNMSGRLTKFAQDAGSPKYASTDVWSGKAGVVEIEDSNIRIQHKSGARIEMLSDGSIEIYSSGNIRQVLPGGLHMDIGGRVDIASNSIDIATNTCGVSAKDTSISLGQTILNVDRLEKNVTGRNIEKISGASQHVYGNGKSSVVIGADEHTVSNRFSLDVGGALGGESIRLQTLVGALQLLQGALPLKNKISMSDSEISIDSLVGVVVTGLVSILMEAPIIQIGSSAIDGVCKASFLNLFETHIHTDPVSGVSGPPVGIIPGSLSPLFSTIKLRAE